MSSALPQNVGIDMSRPWSTLRAFSTIVDDSSIRSISDVNRMDRRTLTGVTFEAVIKNRYTVVDDVTKIWNNAWSKGGAINPGLDEF